MIDIDDLKNLNIDLDEDKAGELKKLLDAKHQEALSQEVDGLKSKRDELLDSQRKLKDRLSEFDGIDVDKARQLQQLLEKDEDARLLAEGNVDAVFERRTKAMRDEYETKLQDAQTQAEALRDRALNDEVRRAASQAGVLPSAVDDILLRAKGAFTAQGDGQIVPKDGMLGKDGKELHLIEWMEATKENAPHLFPAPHGGGAPGNPGGGTGPRSWDDAKTAADKVAFLDQQRG